MGAAEDKIGRVEAILGYEFKDKSLVRAAITHPSASEGRPISDCYERLEFLGDSILGAIVALDMYERFPEMNEGELTRLKVSLVSGETLSTVGSELGIGDCIIFGESEKGSGARGMRSALENVYESLVGAMYLDGGMAYAHEFVIRTLQPHMSRERAMRPDNPKSRLQEITQRDLRVAPEYKLVGREGPAHAPTFTSVVMVDGKRIGRGSGSSKKEAESHAASDAIARLGLEDTDKRK
jgi:ribonuclease-3